MYNREIPLLKIELQKMDEERDRECIQIADLDNQIKNMKEKIRIKREALEKARHQRAALV